MSVIPSPWFLSKLRAPYSFRSNAWVLRQTIKGYAGSQYAPLLTRIRFEVRSSQLEGQILTKTITNSQIHGYESLISESLQGGNKNSFRQPQNSFQDRLRYGSMYLINGLVWEENKFWDPGSLNQDPGSLNQDPWTRILDPGSRILCPGPGSWIFILRGGHSHGRDNVFRLMSYRHMSKT